MNQNSFIELNRTFFELSTDYTKSADTDNLDIREALGLRIGNTQNWHELLKEYRVILLAEAGSGKTEEIRQTTIRLRYQGNPAFFIRLEHISSGLEGAFEEGNFEEFQAWLRSNDEGWLLLDSVDEARLRDPRDFEWAIKKIGHYLSPALQRTHIIITGRVNAWRPKTDLALCRKYLAYEPPEKKPSPTERKEMVPEDGNSTVEIRNAETKDESENTNFKFHSLTNLSREQIETFLQGKSINDTSKFLDDIERQDAWAYTTRPQDLEEIVEYWNKNKRVGSRLELMWHSVNRRLNERDQDRADAEPITAKKALEGVKLIAAATTFMHESTIRVPDGNNNTVGINTKSILTDWNDKECLTLIGRPIFDEAIYGTVRFHHRSVREFLTAKWIVDLLNNEASRRRIEALFFREQYGIQVIVPSLKPILSWLVIFDEKIRKKVCDIEPEIIFEGGDPSRLPLETRREILKSVCKKLASYSSSRSVTDYAAVQRFANPDMAEDIKILIAEYKDNPEITSFLLRMVWQGRIGKALPEAKSFAINNKTEKYTCIAAIRAVKETGSKQDYNDILQAVLSEEGELSRRLVSELSEQLLDPTEESIKWIFDALEKVKDKKKYGTDDLNRVLVNFVNILNSDLLTLFIELSNQLLKREPVIERRYCKISQSFGWLMDSCVKAIEKLILSHHSSALNPDCLSILTKIPVFHQYQDFDYRPLSNDNSDLIREWPELNYALFWKDVEETREAQYQKRGTRLTNWWQVSVFERYWGFHEGDFELIKSDISKRESLDDRLVALSLAFQLYKENGRPREWREQLKQTAANEEELKKRLDEFLHPSAQSQENKKWKKQEAQWKREEKKREKKRQQYHAEWLKWLSENLEILRDTKRLKKIYKEGKCLNAQLYLLERMRELKGNSSQWTQANWKDLIKEYGLEIAAAFRDGLVDSWRFYKPTLRSKKDEDGGIPWCVILGLSGLEIESGEINSWPNNLSEEDVGLACRYAFWELNGFPNWFPKLHRSYPNIVSSLILKEIEWELKTEEIEKDKHYVISKVNWGSEWLWDDIAPELLKKLQKEPLNLQNLSHLLKIIQSSSAVADQAIAKLAYRKCKTLKDPDHLAYWFAAWIGVEPEPAIEGLSKLLIDMEDKEAAKNLGMKIIVNLVGDLRSNLHVRDAREAYKTPRNLQKLYLLMHEYIKVEEDINRAGTGTYAPQLRDEAQDARNRLFSILKDIPGKEAFSALLELSKAHPVESYRQWTMHHARHRAEMDADISGWNGAQFLEFSSSLESTPTNHRELFDLAEQRLLDLKYDLEEGDTSNAQILIDVKETIIRNFIGGWCRERAKSRYSIPQEEELADAKKPDLRFHGVGFDAPVPVELKLANNWYALDLFERLENQLCGDYLRDNRSNRGIFLLVYQGEKTWNVPNGKQTADFYDLIEALQNQWKKISPNYSNVEQIKVIGIDLTKRSK